MRPLHWPAPARHVTVTVYTPDPVGEFTSRSADHATTRELSGVTGRSLRFGEHATPAMRFYGDLGELQHFRGAASLEQTNYRGSGDPRAFPSTKPTMSAALGLLEAAYGPYGSDGG